MTLGWMLARQKMLGEQHWQNMMCLRLFHVIAPFFNLPPDPEGENAKPELKAEEMLAALDVLLWQWKSALQREWYPFLMGLRQDILLKTGAMNRLRQQKSPAAIIMAQ